jgi:enoyl-CoA hydratase/carnithine racemase
MTAEADLISVERRGEVAVVRLCRERKLNAISMAMEAQLLAALEREPVASSRAVVVAGSPRAFSAGADLTEIRSLDPHAIAAYYRHSGEVYERVAALTQPTVAAVSGWCLGGGFELALACDFRVVDLSATFGLPEVGLGIVPSSGGLYRVVRAVGPATARELLLLGRRLDARQAQQRGLVTEVVTDPDPLPRALELANELSELPPLAVAIARQAIDRVAESSREAALLIERLAYSALNQTPEARREPR